MFLGPIVFPRWRLILKVERYSFILKTDRESFGTRLTSCLSIIVTLKRICPVSLQHIFRAALARRFFLKKKCLHELHTKVFPTREYLIRRTPLRSVDFQLMLRSLALRGTRVVAVWSPCSHTVWFSTFACVF